MRKSAVLSWVVVSLALGLAACGGDDGGSSASSGSTQTEGAASAQQGSGERADAAPAGEGSDGASKAGDGDGGGSSDGAAGSPGSGDSSGGGAGSDGGGSGGGQTGGGSQAGSYAEVLSQQGEAAGDDDRAAATEVVDAYFAARAASDWATVCDTLSTAFKQQFLKTLARSPKLEGKDCPTVMAALGSGMSEEARRQEAAGTRVTEVRVDGDSAFVLLDMATVGDAFLPIARDGGEWKVAALGASAL